MTDSTPPFTEKARLAAEWLRDRTPEGSGLPADRPCYRCGKNPAEGFASIWTQATGERWYCHGDDDESPTCYEAAPQPFPPDRSDQ